jgi:hypothetical protein
MEQQLLTSGFWEALGAVDIPLLILVGFIGWKTPIDCRPMAA